MNNNGRFVYKFVGAKLEVQNKRYRANDFLLILFNSGEICFSIKKKKELCVARLSEFTNIPNVL